MRFGCLAVFIAALSTSAMAIEDSRVPGGVAVIPIEPDSRPTFDGKPVLTITDNGQDLAVVGLPLSLEP
ncbi:MAG TPA: peptidase M23, partial [Gammaproteobacteria bacterium]|nr:peptidase M23 [Gammaproteobacteria bacterium]